MLDHPTLFTREFPSAKTRAGSIRSREHGSSLSFCIDPVSTAAGELRRSVGASGRVFHSALAKTGRSTL